MPPELPRCVFQGSSVHAIVEARLDTQTIFGFRCEVFSETAGFRSVGCRKLSFREPRLAEATGFRELVLSAIG
jgi:hypothetical protein